MKLKHSLFIIPCSIFLFASCSVSRQISKRANTVLINDTAISTGHIGISIYEPATNTYWYNYNATKNFIPASNTKLFTLYAGMKYLGDSLVGIYYDTGDNYIPLKKSIDIIGNADPTFLHPDFKHQPVFDFLKNSVSPKITLLELEGLHDLIQPFQAFGKGWAWDDYNSSYMAERNFFPMYGNVVTFTIRNKAVTVLPSFFSKVTHQYNSGIGSFNIERSKEKNDFSINLDLSINKKVEVPIKFEPPCSFESVEADLLSDTLKRPVTYGVMLHHSLKDFHKIHSQPSDSLFKPMMHRSDNFFAEQTLLMASNEHLGYMSDEKIIDTILNYDLKNIPQKPRWVDGSGLSRYNLFTPQSFVYILNKMKTEFGWDRVKNILPTGGTGTLSSYYKKDSSFIYAKTGTLSNNCALSGYLITKKGKFLIFSILVNNYQSGATPVRKAVELFLTEIREKY